MTLLDLEKVRQIGISNIYDPALLLWLLETSKIKPSVVYVSDFPHVSSQAAPEPIQLP